MTQTISPQNGAITYVGRWADKVVGGVPSKVLASGGGNPARFRFTGTSLALIWALAAGYAPAIEYRIDGGAWTTARVSAGSNALAAGLASGTHTFECWMKGFDIESARWANPPALQGIAIDDGAALSAYPTGAAGRMLVLGDSINEGLICTGYVPGADNVPYHYGRLSFINRVCSALNVECWNHSFGGTGFMAPYGDVPITGTNYALAANGIAAADPSFDLIFIEVVHNDGSTDSTTFRARYTTVINALRAAHPAATVFCMAPLAPWSPDLADDVAAVASATGSILIDPTGWSFSAPYANHPDLAGHQAIAAYVQPLVAPYVPAATTTTTTTTTTTAAPTTTAPPILAAGNHLVALGGSMYLPTPGGRFRYKTSLGIVHFAASDEGKVCFMTSQGVKCLA